MVGTSGAASLNIDEVAASFAEAQETLLGMGEQLTRLAALHDEQAATRDALSEASSNIAKFAEAASERMADLAEAQQKTSEVLRAGADVLDGSQLSDISSSVADLNSSVSDLKTELGQIRDAIQHQANTVEKQIEAAKAEIAADVNTRADALTAQSEYLNQLVVSVRERVQRSVFGRIF